MEEGYLGLFNYYLGIAVSQYIFKFQPHQIRSRI